MRTLQNRLAGEDGFAVIEGLLAFGLVLLVVAVATQAFAYAHARSVALAAAQDGAETAAISGPDAGTSRAQAVLTAAGGVGAQLRPTSTLSADEVTVRVDGPAPSLFHVAALLPSIAVSASVPLERYPTNEAAP
jgi:hypothetical protein